MGKKFDMNISIELYSVLKELAELNDELGNELTEVGLETTRKTYDKARRYCPKDTWSLWKSIIYKFKTSRATGGRIYWHPAARGVSARGVTFQLKTHKCTGKITAGSKSVVNPKTGVSTDVYASIQDSPYYERAGRVIKTTPYMTPAYWDEGVKAIDRVIKAVKKVVSRHNR